MSTAPLVSVCVPVYNGERFLRETIESVLAQTFHDFEVVLLDNASTDGTAAVAADLAARDSRVTVFRNDAVLPMGGNWEKCVSLSRGAYVGLLSADDMYLPDFLEEGRKALDSGRAIFSANHLLQFLDGRRRRRRMWAPEGERRGYLAEVLLKNPFSINFTLFRREVLEDARRRDGRVFKDALACDYDLWMRLADRFPLTYAGRALGVYRVHGANLSSDKLRMYREALAVIDDNWPAIRRSCLWTGRFTRLRILARVAAVRAWGAFRSFAKVGR